MIEAVSELVPLAVGMTTAEAEVFAKANGWELRVGRLNGKTNLFIADYRVDRMNVWIEFGFVKKAYMG